MKLTLDVEHTVTKKDGKTHFDPFEPDNDLVMIGTLTDKGEEKIFTVYHNSPQGQRTECEGLRSLGFDGLGVQELLDTATVLIGHNIVHDLVWLWESGFTYTGPVFDTMLAEYVLQRGQKKPLSLEMCAERYDLSTKKQGTLKDYLSKGVSVADIPHEELSSYLSADLHATQELYDTLNKRLTSDKDSALMEPVILSNRVAISLANIYRRGFKIDQHALDKVKEEFETERVELEGSLDIQITQLMGDIPINLNSPEQLSWVVYSRKPKDKRKWADEFTHGMVKIEFSKTVNLLSDKVYKSRAVQCSSCYGVGKLRKTKKNGAPFARPSKCSACDGVGYIFKPTKELAGLKFSAPNVKWISAHGFTTGKSNIEMLEHIALGKNMLDAATFLKNVRRLSALDTYLSSFVDGIKSFTKPDGMLHVQLTQHMTSTGRFSGRNPNMQNMPRGGTFPIKRVFVSRFDGGKILEADFAQLEFRTAAFLSQDEIAMQEVSEGFDVHSYTAKVISDAGLPTSRQEAKAHTFAPLYGATGYGRGESVAAYYRHFISKYRGIAKWHSRLASEALNTGVVKTPSHREFAFPHVTRRWNGDPTHFTQIKNYPVQSFATADIVPLALLYMEELLSNRMSCIVNTVHDSIVVDVHPEEEEYVIEIIESTNNSLHSLIFRQWGVDFNVPLLLEAKIGDNWLDIKELP
jgi:DNA polymerase I-like protein with 3'-5' exonuclease and polymerase domains